MLPRIKRTVALAVEKRQGKQNDLLTIDLDGE